MSSGVFATFFSAIRPSHLGQVMTSTANTRCSSQAHGWRDAGLVHGSSSVASPSNTSRSWLGSTGSGVPPAVR